MARQIRYGDMTIAVPDDASDDEVSAIIETKEQEARVSAQPGTQPGMLERGGRYLAEWGQGMRDAAMQPVGGPTGIPLVDAAAGVADFGASAVSDTLTAVPRLARMAFTGARGGEVDPAWLVREPTTDTGRAIQETLGAAVKPVGDTLSATGLPPEVAQFGMEALGTAADVAGLAGVGRGVRHGARALRPDVPDPGNPRPFSESVRSAREAGYPLLPSQVGAKAQTLVGEGRLPPSVPGSFRETFASPALEKQFAIDSQKVTNRLAARELGVSGITPMGLRLAKNPHLAVFEEVVQALPVLRNDGELLRAGNALGAARRDNPLLRTTTAVEEVRDALLSMESVPTQKALDAIREYRQTANKFYRQADMGGTGSEVAEQAGEAYRAAADALEVAIERQVNTFYPDLVPRLREARTQLAKIHNVEDSFDGVNVDPQMVYALSKRYPLSGYLRTIADVARDFPDTNVLTTGTKLPTQSNQSFFNTVNLAARRLLGRETQNPMLLSPSFQNRYGRADPNFDPRPAPQAGEGASPFAEFAPRDPNVPGGADVMPPTQGGGDGIAAVGLGDQFDTLPPAEALPGDLTASTPPMGGSLPSGLLDDLVDATDLGLEQPTRRFTAGEDGVMDEGLAFALDPDMASAPIVRGGGDPRTVQDSLLSDELTGRPDENLGRPLDFETASTLAPLEEEMVTRPAADLGDQLGTGFGELEGPPRLEGPEPPMEGEFIPGERGPRGAPDRRPSRDPNAQDADILNLLFGPEEGSQGALPAPQRRLPPPDEPPAAVPVEPGTPPKGGVDGGLVDELTVEDSAPRAETPAVGEIGPEYEPPPNAITVKGKGRSIVLEPVGDRLAIRHTSVDPDKRGKGLGQQNIVDAVYKSIKLRKPLDSDVSFTRSAWNAWQAALDKGLVAADDVPYDAINAAMEQGRGVARNPTGESWIKDIRLGPAG